MSEKRASDDRRAEDDELYDLDLDDTEPDTDRVMREAVAAVDRRSQRGEAGDEDRGDQADDSSEVARLRAEVEQLQERSLRTLADYENFRRRVGREKAESRREAEMGPLREVLPVIDNLERALAAEGGVEELKQGVEMIQRQLLDLLSRFGVEPLPPAEGEPFDPTRHEAIFREEDSSVETPMVSTEVQRGYRAGERLLRPSMVHVAVPPGEESSDVPASSDEESVS